MRVVIQQVDMDTALTAWLFGVSRADEVVAVADWASVADLADPSVLCIEAGGSGETELLNFDHHDTPLVLNAACRQAFEYLAAQQFREPDLLSIYRETILENRARPCVRRLVDYVATMDIAGPRALPTRTGFPKLSEVFSGMRLSIPEPVECLFFGMNIFETVVSCRLEPLAVMPVRSEWREWIERKRLDNVGLARELARAQFFRSAGGFLVGYLHSPHVKILGGLYGLGCQIAIAHSAQPGAPAAQKYRVGSPRLRLDPALERLQALETGWGGPSTGTIFGGPRLGSALPPERVIRIVCQEM